MPVHATGGEGEPRTVSVQRTSTTARPGSLLSTRLAAIVCTSTAACLTCSSASCMLLWSAA